jgi:hypothetical protein
MSPTLPKYVEYGPRETAPPPFVSGGGNFLGLILKGDITAIRKLCNKVLNKPFKADQLPGLPKSPFTYKPFSDVVVLFAGRWEGLSSTPMKDRGSANEDEVSLWVPLRKWDDESGKDLGVCMMVPYLFVDNPMSLLNGREDYGYQKSYGKLRPSPLPGMTLPVADSVAVEAFGGVFGPLNTADWVKVMRVDPWVSGFALPTSPPAGSPFQATVLREILWTGVNQVFLKQFRDAAQAGKACYQHLLEAPVTFENANVKLKLGQWRVEIQIPSPSSHPITEDLGVKTQVTPFAFELSSGLKLEAGQIIV